jgi:hypothetical protein
MHCSYKMDPPWLNYQVNNTAPTNVSSLATLSGQQHCSYKWILLSIYNIRLTVIYFIEVEHTSACYGRARTHGQNTVAHHWKLLQFSQAVCARCGHSLWFLAPPKDCVVLWIRFAKKHTHTHALSLPPLPLSLSHSHNTLQRKF